MNQNSFTRSKRELELIDQIANADANQLKLLIKNILAFEQGSEHTDELCVLMDIKTALGLYTDEKDNGILTENQKIVFNKHLLEDKPQAVVAKEMGVTQQTISLTIQSGLKRIKKYFADGEVNWVEWTDAQREFLLSNYKLLGPDKTSNILGKPKSKVISMYHVLARSGGDGVKS